MILPQVHLRNGELICCEESVTIDLHPSAFAQDGPDYILGSRSQEREREPTAI